MLSEGKEYLLLCLYILAILKILFLFLIIYECMCACVWVCACEHILVEARKGARVQGVVSHLMWVLGLELKSSARAVSACNNEAISLAPLF